MTPGRHRFPPKVLAAIGDGQVLGIHAGTQPHRIVGIWAVVVEGRVFVRSWSLKPRSWFRAFQEEPQGIVAVEGREIPVRAVLTRSERLKDAVSRAYLVKYHTPGSLKYARDLGRARSRATTTERAWHVVRRDSDPGAGDFHARTGFRHVGNVVYRGNPLAYYEMIL